MINLEEIRLYEIPDDIRNNIIMDITNIDGASFRNLDEYLSRFFERKKLVYAYAKYLKTPEKISNIHKLFDFSDLIERFYTEEFNELRKNNKEFDKVLNKYIRDPYTWQTSHIYFQSILFDSKYLKIKKFHEIAKLGKDMFYSAQQTHHISNISGLRYYKKIIEHNEFFIERFHLIKNFWENILKQYNIPEYIKISYSQKRIEFYNSTNGETYNFSINNKLKLNFNIIFTKKHSSKKSKLNSFSDTYDKFKKEPFLDSIYFHIKNNIMDFLELNKSINYLKEKHNKVYRAAITTFKEALLDYKNENGAAFTDFKEFYGVSVNPGTVEVMKIKFHPAKSRSIHVNKITYFVDGTQYEHRPVYVSIGQFNEIAEHLFDQGFIDLKPIEPTNLGDYFLLAQNKIQLWTSYFMKLTAMEALEFIQDYINEIENIAILYSRHLDQNKPLKEYDRDYVNKYLYNKGITSYPEWVQYKKNFKKFSEEKISKRNRQAEEKISYIKYNKDCFITS